MPVQKMMSFSQRFTLIIKVAGFVRRQWLSIGLVFTSLLLVAGCSQEAEQRPPQVRPVQVTTVERGHSGQPMIFTGYIQAQDEASLALSKVDCAVPSVDRAAS